VDSAGPRRSSRRSAGPRGGERAPGQRSYHVFRRARQGFKSFGAVSLGAMLDEVYIVWSLGDKIIVSGGGQGQREILAVHLVRATLTILVHRPAGSFKPRESAEHAWPQLSVTIWLMQTERRFILWPLARGIVNQSTGDHRRRLRWPVAAAIRCLLLSSSSRLL